MNTEWLSSLPDKKAVLDSLNMSSEFLTNRFPLMKLKMLPYQYNGMYCRFDHYLQINSLTAPNKNSYEFLNTFLHELGHSTSKYSGRIDRIIENTGYSNKVKYSLEEIIAECLAVVLYCGIYKTGKCPNIEKSIKYMCMYAKEGVVNWGEIDLALEVITKSKDTDIYLKYSHALKRMISRNNVFQFKGGLYL